MAIQKSKSLNNGTSGNYWRILQIVIDREAYIARGRIGLFKDAATSAAGGTHLGLVKSFEFTFTMGEIAGVTNIINYMYGKILDKANTMVTIDLTGATLGSPIPFDSDIAGGTLV